MRLKWFMVGQREIVNAIKALGINVFFSPFLMRGPESVSESVP